MRRQIWWRCDTPRYVKSGARYGLVECRCEERNRPGLDHTAPPIMALLHSRRHWGAKRIALSASLSNSSTNGKSRGGKVSCHRTIVSSGRIPGAMVQILQLNMIPRSPRSLSTLTLAEGKLHDVERVPTINYSDFASTAHYIWRRFRKTYKMSWMLDAVLGL
jgi:hypothetical protein